MARHGATSPTTSSASTTRCESTRRWAICRPMSTSSKRQPNHPSTCPKLLDHYMTGWINRPGMQSSGTSRCVVVPKGGARLQPWATGETLIHRKRLTRLPTDHGRRAASVGQVSQVSIAPARGGRSGRIVDLTGMKEGSKQCHWRKMVARCKTQ